MMLPVGVNWFAAGACSMIAIFGASSGNLAMALIAAIAAAINIWIALYNQQEPR